MRVRVQGATAVAGFDPAKMKADRPIALDDQDSPCRGSGLFWPRRALLLGRNPGPGPGCGLGAGERAPRGLSARMGHGSWAGFAGARARVSRPWAARVLAGPKWPNK